MLQEQRLNPHDSRHNSQADHKLHSYSRTPRYVSGPSGAANQKTDPTETPWAGTTRRQKFTPCTGHAAILAKLVPIIQAYIMTKGLPATPWPEQNETWLAELIKSTWTELVRKARLKEATQDFFFRHMPYDVEFRKVLCPLLWEVTAAKFDYARFMTVSATIVLTSCSPHVMSRRTTTSSSRRVTVREK
jgi:hypothetical protein